MDREPNLRRRPRAFLIALGVLVSSGCGPQSPTGPGTPGPTDDAVDVLFVGNSLTYWNSMPQMLDALLEHDPEREYRLHVVAIGGTGLQDHWVEGTARARIAAGGMDIVVLQQGPSATEGRPSLLDYSQRFAEEIRTTGGIPALYMVWPSLSRIFDADGVSDSYRTAARLVKGGLFPAGDAWTIVREGNAPIALYGSDDFHPSVAGSYLVALVMYGQLTGRDPVGLPAPASTFAGAAISAEDARVLQEAAAAANAADGVACELHSGAGCDVP